MKETTMNEHNPSKRGFGVAVAAVLLLATLPVCAADLPSSPDGTVMAVAEALADRHPEVLWQALPPTYQKDITELTHAFAAKMDPAVWDAAFGLGRKTANLLRDKKAIILDSSMLQAAGEERAQIADGWDEMVGSLDAFFASGVSSLETLKTINWENYLATTGRDLMNLAAEKSKADGDDTFDREFTQKLRQTKVEVVSNDGDHATLRMTAPDETPEEERFTRVEGRWVPSDMADDWDKNVAEARKELAEITDEQIQQGSMQAMMMIGMVDGVLTQLESVTTAEEFDQAIGAVLGPLLGGMMGAGDEIVEETEVVEDTESE
jgi:hypothetical protein